MIEFARLLAGLLAAAVVQAGLAFAARRGAVGALQAFDPFLVLTVFVALRRGLLSSAAVGTLTGLARDALSGGVFGLYGFVNTLLAYVTARVQAMVVIHQTLQVSLLAMLAAAFQLSLLALLQFLVIPNAELPDPSWAAAQMLTTGLAVGILWQLAGELGDRLAERRAERSRRLRLGTRP